MVPEAERGVQRRAHPVARPAVSIVLPFHGTPVEAEAALDTLLAIERMAGDEVIVVDNSGASTVPARDGVAVIAADEERSSYYTRNVGAEAAVNEWLLFLDADCRPQPDILGRYFDVDVPDDVGAVVGEVVGVPDQDALVSRYARSRGHLGQLPHWTHPFRPWGVTANLLVRRAAWESIGGFHEGIRSAGDTEFSWRLQDAGWNLTYRPSALVEHHHRDSVRKLARQAARYGAGGAWVLRRYAGSLARPRLARELARCAGGILVWAARGRFERAAFKALDGVYVASTWGARLLSNTPPAQGAGRGSSEIAAVTAVFPALDDPGAVARVQAMGSGVVVEAIARPVRVDRAAARSLPVAWAEDDGTLRRCAAALWLMVRRPWRTTRYAVGAGLRRGDDTPRPSVLAVASRARRLAEADVRELRAVGPQAEPDAAALADLLGLRLG